MNDKNDIIQEQELLDDERISLFLQGKMSSDEEKAFLNELKGNEDLRNRAIAQARLVKGMRQVDDEIKEAFRQSDEETIRNIAESVSRKKKHSVRWYAVAASVAIIAFIGFKSYDYYDTTSLGKEYANTFPTSTIIRGDADADVESELSTLFNNVAEGKDLDNTTSRLLILWEQSKQGVYNEYTDYAPYIGWNLAIGYLENYEKSKAKDVLMEMNQIYPEGSIMGDKVKVLFDHI